MWVYMNILTVTMKRYLTVLKDRRVKLCAEKSFSQTEEEEKMNNRESEQEQERDRNIAERVTDC